jgi:hypothetical protein
MILKNFLSVESPLTGVELLPDNRLINVIIGNGTLYGVEVDDIPSDVTVTQINDVTLSEEGIIAAGNYTFDSELYTLLS